ncbi:MAG: MBL fold metallo-hydrolase RNA specificity domain-containing protein [Nitrososphaeria archaeon]
MIHNKVAFSKSGILIKHNDKVIALDPEERVKADLTFVSHAHMDHLLKNEKNTVLASKETVELARERGVKINSYVEAFDDVQLIDSGHILGSRAIIIGKNEIMYTGDFSQRDRGFLKKLEPVSVRLLIIESTYGKKGYRFPPTASIIESVMKMISEAYDAGMGVSLQGYTLGKAQLIEYLFQSWKPLIVHRNIEKMNAVYRKFGINIPKPDAVVQNFSQVPDTPFVYVAPTYEYVNNVYYSIKFTGWAKFISNYAVPLSDHADHDELISFVKRVNPEIIITVHGFDKEFAKELRSLGFRAFAFTDQQLDLDSFIYV